MSSYEGFFDLVETVQRYIKTAEKAHSLFPNEVWIKYSDNVFIAESRKKQGDKSKAERQKLEKELKQAEILAGHGHIVYLVPEVGKGKHYDAIVDGIATEFKCVKGNRNRLGHDYVQALKQGVSVFIRTSGILRRDVYTKFIGSAKKILQHGGKIKEEGKIYLWIDGEDKLICWSQGEIVRKARDLL